MVNISEIIHSKLLSFSCIRTITSRVSNELFAVVTSFNLKTYCQVIDIASVVSVLSQRRMNNVWLLRAIWAFFVIVKTKSIDLTHKCMPT